MATATRAPSTRARNHQTDAPPKTEEQPKVTGYDTDLRFYATRYKQGGRTVYSLDLSLLQVEALIRKPDPNTPTPGNRAIRPAHAEGFGKYVRERENWIAPGMILRASDIFEFEILHEVEGTQFGILSFPRQAAQDIHILDGQHRTLGIYRASEMIAADLDKARSALATARRVDPDSRAVDDANNRIAFLNQQRKRLNNERVSVQIYIEDDPSAYKQMFFDIADNALGITSSVKARFDTRKVVNRALESVLEHPLLLGRVDQERDRVGRGSPYLMGAKHVAEMVRSAQVGLDGRVSRRQDAEWNELDVAKRANTFLDILMEAFPPMKALALGQLLPDDLRKTNILGSVLFVRVLAGVYHDLKEEHAFTDEMVRDFFLDLAPHLSSPSHENSIWIKHLPPGVFTIGGFAPQGRRQDLKTLKNTLVDWAIVRPQLLKEIPALAPAPEPTDEDHPEYGAGYAGFDLPEAARAK